ncbi:MAG: hypothetical protein HZA95_02470 [Candidatus Vogelbacteria bacterium]|nr:hypothetical protein [Candidatus Vogelbacteria bacterium]
MLYQLSYTREHLILSVFARTLVRSNPVNFWIATALLASSASQGQYEYISKKPACTQGWFFAQFFVLKIQTAFLFVLYVLFTLSFVPLFAGFS